MADYHLGIVNEPLSKTMRVSIDRAFAYILTDDSRTWYNKNIAILLNQQHKAGPQHITNTNWVKVSKFLCNSNL